MGGEEDRGRGCRVALRMRLVNGPGEDDGECARGERER